MAIILMTRQKIMTMLMLLLGFIGCTASDGATKPTNLRNLQSSSPCEDKGATSKGQCENNGQGNKDLCCWWTEADTCITLPENSCTPDSMIDIGTSSSPAPSAIPPLEPILFPTSSQEPTTLKPTTARPTERPVVVVVPTNTPTPKTLLPTSDPTDKPDPTVPVREYDVTSSMVLFGMFDEMDRESEDAWANVTHDKIYNKAIYIIGDAGSNLRVAVKLDDQKFVESTLRMLASEEHGVVKLLDNDAPIESAVYHGLRRSLQSTTQVRLNFTTTIKFDSPQEWDATQMVVSGFTSPADQTQYINSLKAADPAAFEDVNQMFMSVEEVMITETENENEMPTPKKDNSIYYIIAGAVSAGLLLLVAGGLIYTRQKKDDESQQQRLPNNAPVKSLSQDTSSAGTAPDPPPREALEQRPLPPTSQQQQIPHNSLVNSLPQDKLSVGPAPDPPQREAFEQRPLPPTLPSTQNYFATIEPREGEDDISTLGYPYFGDGVPHHEPHADDTVADSMISSEQKMYVYGVGRERLNTGNSSNPSGRIVFEDDATFEDAYQTPYSAR